MKEQLGLTSLQIHHEIQKPEILLMMTGFGNWKKPRARKTFGVKSVNNFTHFMGGKVTARGSWAVYSFG